MAEHKEQEIAARFNKTKKQPSSDDSLDSLKEKDHSKWTIWSIWPFCGACGATTGIVLGLGGLVQATAYLINLIVKLNLNLNRNEVNMFDLNMNHDNNTISAVSLRPNNPHISLMPYARRYMPTESYQFIINATEKDPATLVPNGKPFDWYTDVVHPDILDDQIILDDQVILDIKNNDFQKEIVEYWLRRDLNIEAKHKDTGLTLLFYAVAYGREPLVRFLIEEKRANVNAQNADGFTPLAFAMANEYIEYERTHINIHKISKCKRIIDLLIEHEGGQCREYNMANSDLKLLKKSIHAIKNTFRGKNRPTDSAHPIGG